jgi:tetratricopeptide (TPR) repeat protein
MALQSYSEARWQEGHDLLTASIAATDDDLERARLRAVLLEGFNFEDFKCGLQPGRDKLGLADEVERVAAGRSDAVHAAALYGRGMALHIDFIMAEGDQDREVESFTRATELYGAAGDQEGAALSTAMVGVFHHVDRLDRETANPILQRAYDMSPSGPSFARSEAARHLGQIAQELGDHERGLEILQESLRIREELGWSIHLPSALHVVGYAQLELGRLDEAAATLARAREVGERIGARLTLAFIARTEADVEMATLVPGVWRRTHP